MAVQLFATGAEFASFQELLESKTHYEESTYINLNVKRSRLIDAPSSLGRYTCIQEKTANPILRYCEISYECYHGGPYRGRKPSNGKKSRKTSTAKLNCPFQLDLSIKKDGKSLVVNKFINDHNHALSKEVYDLHYQQRKLSPEEEKEAKLLLSLNADLKKVQEYLHSKNKMVTTKDLQNLKADGRKGTSFVDVKDFMEKHPDFSYEILCDENVCTGIFFQSESMKQTFQAYSEIVYIDTTYKTNDLNMPLCVMMCLDGNGESEVIALALLLNEDKETLSWLAESFKKHNPNYNKVNLIMADKDLTYRKVFLSYFPNAHLLICKFHALRIFRREITASNMGISESEKQLSLEMIQEIFNANDLATCDSLIELLKDSAPLSVVEYFTKNWEPFKSEWVRGLQLQLQNFNQATNNRLECFNGKLKTVASPYGSLSNFFKDLMTVINNYEHERNCRALSSLLKRPTDINENPDFAEYEKLLTTFAYNKIKPEMDVINKVVILEELSQNAATVKSSYGNLHVTNNKCPCNFAACYGLPCRHILRVRQQLGFSVFAEELCLERWWKKNYAKNQRGFRHVELFDNVECSNIELNGEYLHVVEADVGELSRKTALINITQMVPKKTKTKTEIEKFSKARVITDRLCQHLSHLGTSKYMETLQNLEEFCTLTMSGTEFAIVQIETAIPTQATMPTLNNIEWDQQTIISENLEVISELTVVCDDPQPIVHDMISSDRNLVDMNSLKLPPKKLKYGRPKGLGKTQIGLPVPGAKKKRKSKRNT